MRVLTVKGRPVTELLAAPGTAEKIRSRWALRRQFMTTYRDRLTPSERVVEGRFWEAGASASEAPGVDRSGFDHHHAGSGAGCQDRGRDRMGRAGRDAPIPALTMCRDVEWARFEPNFLVLFPEEGAAGSSAWDCSPSSLGWTTRDARAQIPREVSATFPNVSS